MAKNYVQDGDSLTLIAPAGGVVSGNPYVIGTLAVVALVTAAAGEPFAARATGVFRLPCATGLTQGAKVSLKEGGLVADGTASSFPFGKLTAAEDDGFADCRLSN
ncbi:capsid cement protein [Pseudomonas sp. SO81]|uniref:capsid cement protein n=1 Tax=Pseudomonas sp. SO81 TaxID=2983246 RepID=UPI0025A33B47|nr:capsid cement protein [Pseudomonas sp. SO81]WJN60930.1 Phage RecA/RadA recombinase (ACLAME 286) [Pseudomonas sp. SO81]